MSSLNVGFWYFAVVIFMISSKTTSKDQNKPLLRTSNITPKELF
jgi:hypothetical protein